MRTGNDQRDAGTSSTPSVKRGFLRFYFQRHLIWWTVAGAIFQSATCNYPEPQFLEFQFLTLLRNIAVTALGYGLFPNA